MKIEAAEGCDKRTQTEQTSLVLEAGAAPGSPGQGAGFSCLFFFS